MTYLLHTNKFQITPYQSWFDLYKQKWITLSTCPNVL